MIPWKTRDSEQHNKIGLQEPVKAGRLLGVADG